MIGRDAIIAAGDLPVAAVECPEWGGTVHVRMMTAGERMAFFDIASAKQSEMQAQARLCAFTLCDADGTRMFGNDDGPLLAAKSAVVVGRVAQAAWDLNELGAEHRKARAKN